MKIELLVDGEDEAVHGPERFGTDVLAWLGVTEMCVCLLQGSLRKDNQQLHN
jgi:hypothetical protein